MNRSLATIADNCGRYAFVVPRYGAQVVGGAETLVRQLARKLAARGDYIEIWTTCALDNRNWANVLPSGRTIEEEIPVERFPVDNRDLERWVPLQIHISEGMNLPLNDQLDWMKESVNSAGLYAHILKHADEFDMLFFAPYLFGTTFWGSLLRPDRSMLIPCLHDESYAYTDIMQSMFRQVRGCLFNAAPEQDLAAALYGNANGGEVGMGFDEIEECEEASYEPYFENEFEYLLYFGRKETGKNVHLLVDYFIAAKEREAISKDLRLVIAGGGSFSDVERPQALDREDIVDIGYLTEAEKKQIISHALLVCQPSVNESFSIVLMESWMRAVPVLVHANCAVTRHHTVQSGGGLYFASEEDFAATLARFSEDALLRKRCGVAGRIYVAQQYSWNAVLRRFDAIMEKVLSS